jgi:hypothetical protein
MGAGLLVTEEVMMRVESRRLGSAGSAPAHLGGDAMFSNRRAAALAIIFFLIGFAAVVQAEEPLNVENWPSDIPCNVLKKHPDGRYEITVPWNRFFQRHAPATRYRNTRETAFWDQKCKG